VTRVFVEGPLAPDACLALPEEAARHVGQVLRMRAGEALTLFDGRGGEYRATLEAVQRREVRVRVGEVVAIDRESPLEVTLAQCVSKGARMDFAVQKGVELGVAAIVPLLSAHSVVRVDEERWEKKLEHWRGVMVAACEQSGRTRLPRLAPVRRLDHWLAALEPAAGGARLVLMPEGGVSLRNVSAAARLTLLIGPEGGLSEDEARSAERYGFARLALGPRVLRTETAGIAALAALQALWGDLR
jgi:16S rRNA (uracil1498-N3)-methyltransferase